MHSDDTRLSRTTCRQAPFGIYPNMSQDLILDLMAPWMCKTFVFPPEKGGITKPSLGSLFSVKVTAVKDQASVGH